MSILDTLVQGLRRYDPRPAILRWVLGGVTREEMWTLRTSIARLADEQAELPAPPPPDLSDIERQLAALRAETTAVARALASPPPPRTEDGPLVSVVMPVRDMAAELPGAIASLLEQRYTQWELLLVDDGSEDDLDQALAELGGDERIRRLSQPRLGHAAARNAALQAARGELVAYLDADNRWLPSYLASVVAYLSASDADCCWASQLVERGDGSASIREARWDRAEVEARGGVDLNCFAHRRALTERYGGFDTSLRRLVDWELVLRYTAERPPVCLSILGGVYREAGPNSVSRRELYGPAAYRIRSRHQRLPDGRGQRVLYAVGTYPQLSETYIRWELEWMQAHGWQVEVWAEAPLEGCGATYPSVVPTHRGTFDDALRAYRPDIVHVHYLHLARKLAPSLSRRGLQMTVRMHGFEYAPKIVRELARHRSVARVYLPPHTAEQHADEPKVAPMAIAFKGAWYAPPTRRPKDRRLVLRASPGMAAKQLWTVVDMALRCPWHRFVLLLATIDGHQPELEEAIRYNDERGQPLTIWRDVPQPEAAAWVRRAGIFVHTTKIKPMGQPISIAEAMATGAYVLARRLPALERYLGPAGATYEDTDEAVERIRETERWSEARWREVERAAVEHAYAHHADIDRHAEVAREWLEVLSRRAGSWSPHLDEQQVRRYQSRCQPEDLVLAGIGAANWAAQLAPDDPALGRAALFHKAYGSEQQPADPPYAPARRDDLIAEVGVPAEALVHANHTTWDAAYAHAVRDGEWPPRPVDLAGQPLAVDPLQLAQLRLAIGLDALSRREEGELGDVFRAIAQRLGGDAPAAFERAMGCAG